jgi:ribosomal protein S18 acetylase RimI-like enzyme
MADISILKSVSPPQILDAKLLLDQNSRAVGFVTRAAFKKSAEQEELYVATLAGIVVGFVRFHFRRDGGTTVYEIVTSRDCRRQGVARALVHAVAQATRARGLDEIRLKCPEGSDANGFYPRVGFRLSETVPGRKRRLCVWLMKL